MRFSDLVQKSMSFFNYSLFKESVWPKTLCEKLGRAIACEATSTHSEIKKGELQFRKLQLFEIAVKKIATSGNTTGCPKKVPDRSRELA